MRNRILALAAGVCLCACLCAPAAAETAQAEAIQIVDRAGLEAIADAPSGSYLLCADIDMSGAPWMPLAFSGVFDGGGHTIYNLRVETVGDATATTVDGNRLEYETRFAALFSTVVNAHISDLTLLGVDVNVRTDADCFAACLAGHADNTVIENCRVYGRVQLELTCPMAGVAGLVGFGRDCFISGSTADVTLVYLDTNREQPCESFLGAVMSCGYAQIEGCSAVVRGYASIYGYAHNGGLVGMFYTYDRNATRECSMRNCTADAEITFFEKIKSRRAYCRPLIGENLGESCDLKNNTVDNFVKTESRDYDVPLLPEMCAAPVYDADVTEPACATYGFTTYTCRTCGYAYAAEYVAPRHTWGEPAVTAPTCTEQGYTTHTCALCGQTAVDSYTPPAHQAGAWETAAEPTYDLEGEERRYCTVCGETTDVRALPRLVRVSACVLDHESLSLFYRDAAALTVRVEPDTAVDRSVVWTSSDPQVAMVAPDGTVTAAGRGDAVITCASADGGAAAACQVTVRYTWWQWLLVILLFGWLWY